MFGSICWDVLQAELAEFDAANEKKHPKLKEANERCMLTCPFILPYGSRNECLADWSALAGSGNEYLPSFSSIPFPHPYSMKRHKKAERKQALREQFFGESGGDFGDFS